MCGVCATTTTAFLVSFLFLPLPNIFHLSVHLHLLLEFCNKDVSYDRTELDEDELPSFFFLFSFTGQFSEKNEKKVVSFLVFWFLVFQVTRVRKKEAFAGNTLLFHCIHLKRFRGFAVIHL